MIHSFKNIFESTVCSNIVYFKNEVGIQAIKSSETRDD